MIRSEVLPTAAKLRDAAFVLDAKESHIAQLERIRAAVASDDLHLDFLNHDYSTFYHAVSHGPLKQPIIDELNAQIAVATDELQSCVFIIKYPPKESPHA